MFHIDPPANPPCNYWEEYGKPQLIQEKLQEICKKISQKGENSGFPEVFDIIYEYVEDNITKYLPEANCE